MPYKIVEFHDGFQLVPSNWISHDKSSCYWPPSSFIRKVVDKVIETKLEPNIETWKTQQVLRIVGSSDNYESGMCKVKEAQQNSGAGTSSNLDSKKQSIYESVANDHTANNSNEESSPTQKQFKHKKTKLVNVSKKKKTVKKPLPSEVVYHSTPTRRTLLQRFKNRRPVKKQVYKEPNQSIWQKKISKQLIKITKELKSLKQQNKELKSLKEQNKQLKTICDNFRKKPTNDNDNFIDDDLNELNIGFPVSDENKLINIESEMLNEKEFYSKMVMAFKVLGGTDLNEIVNTILAKLMDNYLAVRYSFAGKQKKESFKDTFPTLVKAIISVVRYHRPESTHKEIHYQIGRWLVQGQLRITRQEKKEVDKFRLSLTKKY